MVSVISPVAAVADGAGQPFACTTATDFLVSGLTGGTSATANQSEPAAPAAVSTYTTLATGQAPGVNSVGFNPVDHYLYAISVADAQLVRIDSAGDQSMLGAVTGLPAGLYNKGAFDPSGSFWMTSGSVAAQIDVATRTAVTHTMSSSAMDSSSDFTYAYGYFWGATVDKVLRYNPATGAVDSFAAPGKVGNVDAAFTYANGDLGFQFPGSNQAFRIEVTNPTSATPGFTQVGRGTSPAPPTANGRDGASCVQTPAVSTTSLPATSDGLSYSATLAATGGNVPADYTWSVTSGSLPAGLSLDSATGAISGSATGSGTSSFTVQVRAGGAFPTTASQALSITVAAPVAVSTTVLPSATYGQSYSSALSASGGSGAYTWSVAAGSLPGGTTLDPATGTISGTPTGTGTANFTIQATDSADPTLSATKPLTLTVDPATLTATVAGAQTYGGATSFTVSGYTGFVNGDNASAVTGVLGGCGTTATPTSNVGNYPVTVSGCTGLFDPNYRITYVDGGYRVGPATATATVSGSETYGSGAPSFAVTGYRGFVNGDTAAAINGSLAGCSTTTPAGTGVGTYHATIAGCSGLSDPNYTVGYTDGGFTVTPAPLVATITAARAYGAAPTYTASSYAGFVDGDGPSSVTGTLTGCATSAPATAATGVYPGTISGCSGLGSANYAISYADGGLTVNPSTLSATVTGSRSYGTAHTTFSVAGYSGFVGGDGPSSISGTLTGCTTSVAGAAAAGNYTATISGCSGLNDPNYTLAYVDGGVTVAPAALTVTASSPATSYGASPTAISAAYTGFVNGDGPSSLTTAPTCSSPLTSSTPAGSYPTTCSGAADANYAISYVDGSATVTKAPLSITASSATTSYGGPAPTVTAAYTGFVNHETAAALTTAPTCSSPVTASSPAGSYPTTCIGAGAVNYAISYLSGSVTVVAASASVTYTGPVQLTSNSTFQPSAGLASSAAACQSGQPIAFTLDVNPSTGAAGPYVLESATTNASGIATGASIKTTSWQTGAYNVTVNYAGTPNCSPSTSSSSIAVSPAVASGQRALGAGTYARPTGAVEFAFVVGLLPKSATKYSGGLSIVENGKWWFAGGLTSYTKSGNQGVTTGSGTLYSWNQSLNHSRGGWSLVKSGVAVTATFTATSKTSHGAFGVQIAYTTTSGQPALPNSTPIAIQCGAIVVS